MLRLPKVYGQQWHIESFVSGLKRLTGSPLASPTLSTPKPHSESLPMHSRQLSPKSAIFSARPPQPPPLAHPLHSIDFATTTTTQKSYPKDVIDGEMGFSCPVLEPDTRGLSAAGILPAESVHLGAVGSQEGCLYACCPMIVRHQKRCIAGPAVASHGRLRAVGPRPADHSAGACGS